MAIADFPATAANMYLLLILCTIASAGSSLPPPTAPSPVNSLTPPPPPPPPAVSEVSTKKPPTPGLKRNVLLIVVDDMGFETAIYGNNRCKTPYLNEFAKKGVSFRNAFASVSSSSPSRSAILTGLPQHENGMYGLHHSYHHFQTFPTVQSLPLILNRSDQFRTGVIGTTYVGPEAVYPFAFSHTERDYPVDQIGRNITLIKNLVREFLAHDGADPFFLYIGLHDPHRCGQGNLQYGVFCEKFGDGSAGMGSIPDWHPIDYSPDDIFVPFFVQDTPEARMDLATQYWTISRMDQGIGLILQELRAAGFEDNTLVIFTSDNGIPFPNGHTNLYDPGIAVPLVISSPLVPQESRGHTSGALVSLTDIVPTILDWYDLPMPNYSIFGPNPAIPLGKSLIPILHDADLKKDPESERSEIYASHSLHEVTMYYPMRAVRNREHKLIHNINYKMPFGIDQDFYLSHSFQDLLNHTMQGRPTKWFKTLHDYYYRAEWELYDLVHDPPGD